MQFKIDIDTARKALDANLTEHIVELKEATAIWTDKVIKALEQMRDAVNREGLKTSNEELQSLFFRRPQDNRAQYSRYIGALTLTKAAGAVVVDMDETEYDCIFNDNWDWRSQSKVLNSSYRN